MKSELLFCFNVVMLCSDHCVILLCDGVGGYALKVNAGKSCDL